MTDVDASAIIFEETQVYGPYRAVVTTVHDGDTIDVQADLGFDETRYLRCRIWGINAPELSTNAGKEARAYATGLLPKGMNVVVYSHGWDKYGGRVDAEIKFPYQGVTTDFGNEMVSSGHAKPLVIK
jgi:endonuclease YncB( thermonuclease family)